MVSTRIVHSIAIGFGAALVASGCSTYSTANGCYTDLQGTQHCPPFAAPSLPAPKPTRATLSVDSLRGNPRVLMSWRFRVEARVRRPCPPKR